MGKSFLRKSGAKRSPKKYILFFREGSCTEPVYINKLRPFKKGYDIYPPVLQNEGIPDNCEEWLNDCKNAYNNISKKDSVQIDSIWFVFDDDCRLNTDKVINFIKTKTIDKKPLHLAFSSMCIEYWILLHFRNHNGIPIYQLIDKDHSCRTIDLINQEIDRCNVYRRKKLPTYVKSRKWLTDNFDFFLEDNLENSFGFLEPKPRIVEAFVRAMKIHEAKIANGNEFEESVTTFYKLLEYLGVVYYKDVIQDPEDLKIYDVVNGCYSKNGKLITIQDTNLIKNEPFLNR